MTELFDRAARKLSFDASHYLNAREKQAMVRNLRAAGFKTKPGEWAGLAIASAALSFAVMLAVLLANAFGALESISIALTTAALAAFLVKRAPEAAARSRAEAIEVDLPACLRSIATELSFNSPFERAIESAAGYGECGRAFAKALRNAKRGKPFHQALRAMADDYDSLQLKRACTQLSFAFEQGEAAGLRQLAGEFSAAQRERVKRYSAKQGVLSLAFIVCGGIVPAFFGAYAIIGSAFLDSSFTPGQILFAFVIFFPLLDATVLYYLRLSAPKVLG